RLVRYGAGGAVDDLGGDLLAPVGGQAVEHDAVGGGEAEQAVVHLVRAERRPAGGLVGLAHRDPDVGGEHVGALGGDGGVIDDAGRSAGPRAYLLGGREDRPVRGVASRGGGPDRH